MSPARKKNLPSSTARRPHGTAAANRSLERGIEILRAFRPGSELLGNGELAERTGLSPATVSRLTQTLVGTGYLEHDRRARAYRLAAPVLSLAHAMQSGSAVLQVAAPLMRRVAEELRVNIGLATPDGDEMVYLESVRYNRVVSLRHVVRGQRIPMELTSLGRAYLAVAQEPEKAALMERFRMRCRGDWEALRRDIDDAVNEVRATGCCVASWQPEVIAIATPIVVPGRPVHVLNLSLVSPDPPAEVAQPLKAPLLDLAALIREMIAAL